MADKKVITTDGIRGSSLSPTSSRNASCTRGGTRPPPPVRPKPKRAITSPLMTVLGRSGEDADDPVGAADPNDCELKLRTKGTVKALAERFDVPRTRSLMDSRCVMMTTSSIGIRDESDQQMTTKMKRQSVAVTAPNLRFPKPPPPAHHRRQTVLLRDGAAANDDCTAPAKAKAKPIPLVEEKPSGAHLKMKENKSADVQLRKKKEEGPVKVQLWKKKEDTDVHLWKKKEQESVDAQGRKKCQGSTDPKDLLKVVKDSMKEITSKRSQSCEASHYPEDVAKPKIVPVHRRRCNSTDSVVPSTIQARMVEELTQRLDKKLSPPAVPPKPIQRPSLTDPAYAEYDVLSSISPYSVFSPPSCEKGIPEEFRRSLPVDHNDAVLTDTPLKSTQTLERYSMNPSTIPLSSLATMELMNDSQLNISGHIYCAVRHGEVIEDDEYDVVPNFVRHLVNAAEKQSTPNGVTGRAEGEADDLSFAAAVFGALELATGGNAGTISEETMTRTIEEDAMTNYEEIIEDTLETIADDIDPEKESVGKKAASYTLNDQSNKWETCSSLTSTSADSGSSSTNNRAPALIGFRRRSSQERPIESTETVSSIGADTVSMINDPIPTSDTPLAELYESSQHRFKKRDTKSARYVGSKSQLDLAANSLWRIKSDIQLNLSQAMGKIRLKVSSGAAGSSSATSNDPGRSKIVSSQYGSMQGGSPKKIDQKARSTFYLPTCNVGEMDSSSVSPHHPTSISITVEAGLAEDTASSAPASSEDDDDEDAWDTDRRTSLGEGGEFEDVTPTAVVESASNLPDLVPQGSRRQAQLAVKTRSGPIIRADDMSSTTDSSGPTSATVNGTDAAEKCCLATPSPCLPLRPSLASESSCSTAASAFGESERFEPIYNSRFAFSEPLYQHYRNQTTASVVQRNQTFSEADARGTISRRDKLLSASQLGSQRTLWCELPEVQNAGVLKEMSDDARKLQEAMFEVITSEASYLRSLNILITHFMASPKLSGNTALGSCITKQERKQLFSNILPVRDCSERLLCALESRFDESVVLEDVCDLLHDHLRQDSEVYVKYCSNQIYQERTLNELRRNNADFRLVVGQLESNPVCECLNLRSFLMLPMQRVTRYPLLIAAVLQRTEDGTQHQSAAQRAYATAGRVVRQCNEGAKRLERIEQLVELDQMLLYRDEGPKRVALVSGSRWLIKKGIVHHLFPRRHTLGVRVGLCQRRLYFFLFTDVVLITKPTVGDKRYIVKDYCQRQFVEVEPLEPSCPQIPEGSNLPPDSHLILCTLMKNHRGRQVQFVFNCDTETDKTRWLEAIRPASVQENGAERIYEPWDCPQVRVVKEYHAAQEDELQLEIGEVINVLRKMPDGWYEGERVRDGEKGWFPGYVTEEILSDHIMAKNYRDRLRLLHEAELLQRSMMYTTGDGGGTCSTMSGTNSRRSSIIPNAAKALFRL